jgi:phospholipid/cholesterol/gamma-HCH transport system ATP-binding protein
VSGEAAAAARAEVAPGGVRVTVEKLNKWFGTNHVLRDLDLAVEPGETFVVIGGSGCGKTVLLKHLIGLLRQDTGRIFLDGHALDPGATRRRVRAAMVFQSSALFASFTVGENVGLWLREHRVADEATIRGIVAEKLALVGLAGTEALLPAALSGGMRKRVAIARALAIEPQLILYDEPTAELDPVMTDVIAELMVDLKRRLRVTALVVTHALGFGAFVGDRMGMLHGGRLIEMGPPAAILRSSHPVVRAFVSSQTRGLEGRPAAGREGGRAPLPEGGG